MKTRKRNLRPANFHWSLSVACNDHRNGGFRGRVESVQIGLGRGNFAYGTDYLDDYELTLEGPAVRFRWLDDTHAQIGRYRFAVRGVKEWVGNWCWDGCFVQRGTVRQLLRFLKSRGWTSDSGTESLWRWFQRQPVTNDA